MTNEEIINGNKLILKFIPRSGSQGSSSDYGDKIPDVYLRKLKYHSSWDWLMPVVKKIEQYQYADEAPVGEDYAPDFAYMRTFHSNMSRINSCTLFEAETQIEATWMSVVNFIKWYNQQTK